MDENDGTLRVHEGYGVTDKDALKFSNDVTCLLSQAMVKLVLGAGDVGICVIAVVDGHVKLNMTGRPERIKQGLEKALEQYHEAQRLTGYKEESTDDE